MPPIALITGINGQDGAYLADFLLKKNYTLYGLIHPSTSLANLDYFGITDKINFIKGDLTNPQTISNCLETANPNEFYNLAALSSPSESWNNPDKVISVNTTAVAHILNEIRQHYPTTKFFQASSSQIFGSNHDNNQQTEETPYAPANPYACSKLASHLLVQSYRNQFNLFCCNGILYNHESPLRGTNFVTRIISEGVAKIKLGIEDHLTLRNLESRRDWGYAGDYVKGMWLMLQQDTPDDYILCTGQTHSIEDFLEAAFNHVGITDWKNKVKLDPHFAHKPEPQIPLGQNIKAKTKLNWQPNTSFTTLVEMMVTEDLTRLS